MRRSSVWSCGLLVYTMVTVASAGSAQGDHDEAGRLTKKLLTAIEEYADLQRAVANHGRRAEIALAILEKEQYRTELVATIRDRKIVSANFPQNRRWWTSEQDFFFHDTLALEKTLNELERQISVLKTQERQLYEEKLRQAQHNGRAAKPFNRDELAIEGGNLFADRPLRGADALPEDKELIHSRAGHSVQKFRSN